ncbi:MFS general substrate transporter [Trematosphaeria pertusa]|uniref:MFS general substrate transporter n=1 Tax=Trematosphaeria pertusa TaxID=390896 RepID=A0A6A6IEB8_9PLEO|nr:MFS general substrate transporter [Trematosphaeria pertusa]KAF2248539.1 MFS general substrate transporter [Trematosphaeria pertusa]
MASTTSRLDIEQTAAPPPILGWNHHPKNARNWPLVKKAYTTLIVSAIGFVSTLATSIYASGSDDVAREFGISHTLALLPLSFYALGMGFGPIIASPMSETYGRKIVYLVTTPLFALFILGSGWCQSNAALCVCRFFAGLFGAPCVSIASATIADTTPPDKRGIPLAIYYSIPFIGSLVGPLVGGFVVAAKGWRWTQWTTLFFAAAIFPLLGFVHESYRKVVIRRIARQEQVELLEPQRDPSKIFMQFFTSTITRPVHMLFTEPIVGFVCLYCSFQFALLYTFIVGSPYIYQVTYGFDIRQQALSFLGLMVGAICAAGTLITMDWCIYQAKHRDFCRTFPNSEFPPEHRLYPSMLGSVILPVGLFYFAWTARPSIPWIVPIVAQGITMLGSILAYVGANMYMVDTYGPLYGASAAGANSLARYILTACFPLFTLHMYKSLGTQWAASLLAFCTVAMAPIPWVFWTWGPKLRGRSRYEREM